MRWMDGDDDAWRLSVEVIFDRAAELQIGVSRDEIRELPSAACVISAIKKGNYPPSELSSLRTKFSADQVEAASVCLAFRVVFLLGNPGTGKTALAMFLRIVIGAIEKKVPVWATPLNRGRATVAGARTLHSLMRQSPFTEKKIPSELFFQPPEKIVATLARLPNFSKCALWDYSDTVMCDEGAYGSLRLLVAAMSMVFTGGGCFIALGDMQQIMPIMSEARFATSDEVLENPIYIMQTQAAHSCKMRFACLEKLHRAQGITTDITRAFATYSDEPIPSPEFDAPAMRPSAILATRVIDEQQALDMLSEGNVIFLCVRHPDVKVVKGWAARHRTAAVYEHAPVFHTKDTQRVVQRPPAAVTEKYSLLKLSINDPVVFTAPVKITEKQTGAQITTYNGQSGVVVAVETADDGKTIVQADVMVDKKIYRVTPTKKKVEAELLEGTMYSRPTAGGQLVSTLTVESMFMSCTIAATVQSQQGIEYSWPTRVVIMASTSSRDHSDKYYVAFTRARELRQIYILSGNPVAIGPNHLSSAVDKFVRSLAAAGRSLGGVSRQEAAAVVYSHASASQLTKKVVTVPVKTNRNGGLKPAREVHRMSVAIAPPPEDAFVGEDSNGWWGSSDVLDWADACEAGRPHKRGRVCGDVLDPQVLGPGRVFVV